MAPGDINPGDEYSVQSEGGPAFDLNRLIQTARKFYWLLIVGLAGGLVLALIAIKRATPVYSSTAEIKVERRANQTPIQMNGGQGIQEGPGAEDLKTIEHSFLNPVLMRRVIDKMQLETRNNFISPGRPANTVSKDELVGFLLANSSIVLVPETRLFDISFHHWDPAVAQEVTNALVDEGIAYDRDQRVSAVGANIHYLEDEAKKMEAKLRESEGNLNNYVREIGSVSLDQDLNIVADQVRELNSQYIEVKSRRLRLEADYEQIEQSPDDPNKLLSVESVKTQPAVVALGQQISALRAEIAKTSARYPAGNMIMQQMRSQLAELERALDREAILAGQSVKAALAVAKSNEASLMQAREEQENKVMQTNAQSIQSKMFQRQIDADRIAYDAALKRLTEELSSARSQPVLVQIVEPASGAYRIAPNPPRILMTFVMGGLMLGAGLIVLIMQLDTSVKSVEEAERALHLPAFASIHKYELPKRTLPEGEFLQASFEGPRWIDCPTLEDQYSVEAEAFRTLRARLQIAGPRHRGDLVLMTSAVPKEGKSFCSINLAVAFAQGGQRTLLVDAQLRKPVIEERLFFTKGHRGLADFLMGATSLSSVIRNSPVPNLDVVCAGSAVSQPSELLSRHQRFSDFLEEARLLYDMVIFDSASLTGVSDTLCFAREFDMVCLVLRASKTSKAVARRAIELLRRIGVKANGLVFNFAPSPFVGMADGYQHISRDDPASELDFPKSCPSCGKIYHNFDEYLEATTPPRQSDLAAVDAPMDSAGVSLFRTCQCGASVVVSSSNRRDTSPLGENRRGVFGELLQSLVDAGMDREEARAKLLLVLKVWQHEIYTDVRDDGSEASGRRREMFGELLDRLVEAGFPRDMARSRLLQTIDIWRGRA